MEYKLNINYQLGFHQFPDTEQRSASPTDENRIPDYLGEIVSSLKGMELRIAELNERQERLTCHIEELYEAQRREARRIREFHRENSRELLRFVHASK